MKDTADSKKVIGKIVGKYIALAIIIGTISFALENIIPQFVDWDFTATFIIYQSVLFVISTLLTIILSVNLSIKKEKIATIEDAKKIAKPVKTILMIVALGVMTVNLIYCYQIEQSGYKDIEANCPQIEGLVDEEKNTYIQYERKRIHSISNIYMATKEIVTILTYAYAIIYVERMIELSATSENKKEKNEEE